MTTPEIPSFLLQGVVYLSAAVIAVPLSKRVGLGAVLGYLSGIIILSFHIEFLRYEDVHVFIVITSLIGLLLSVTITKSKKAKKIQKSNVVRNEAIALITHEMRTGLTSTNWAIQMILEN